MVIEQNASGYTAHCPELEGCSAQGETYEETIRKIKEYILLRLEERLRDGEEIPEPFTPCTMTWSVRYSLN